MKGSTQPVTAVNLPGAMSRQASGEVGRAGSDDPELDAAARRAFASMRFLALCADIEGLPLPEPGPKYAPADYQELAGVLECHVCKRPIREHGVGEFHTVLR